MVSSGAKSFSGPLLLYAVSVGLTGFASLQLVAVLPLHRPESREVAARRGVAVARECLAVGWGRLPGPAAGRWHYDHANRDWWQGFADTNWIGARARSPANRQPPGFPPAAPAGLADLLTIELLVHGRDAPTGPRRSHVVVRYHPRAGVEPPPNAPGLAVQQVWAGGRVPPADSRLWRPLDDYHLVSVEPGTRRARFGHPHGEVVVEQAETTLRPELLRRLLPALRSLPESVPAPRPSADSREERGPSPRR